MSAIFQNNRRAARQICRPALIRYLLAAAFAFVFQMADAQDYGLYWKYKDYDGAIALSVPGWTAKLGSLFVDEKAGKKVLRKVKRVRVLVFQDDNPIGLKDFKKFNRKAKRRNLDELVTVRDGKTRVQIYGKMKRNTIRKIVVFFSSPDEGAGMVSLKGKFNLKDINKTLNQVGKKSKDGEKPVVPPVVNIPVLRV
jgi:hypothetical protein